MGTASNNGLLPINSQQNGQNQGYSQVSPMFGMYYNAAQAPSGNQVLGYNSASGYMPGATNGASYANPAAPTGGSMAVGASHAPATGTSNPGLSSSVGGSSSGYGQRTSANASPSYAAANNYASQQYGAAAQPVAAPARPAQPMYNPNGPLASPQNHMIPAQVQANSSGQMQGSSQPVMHPQAYAQAQTQPVTPPSRPVVPGSPIPTPIGVGDPRQGIQNPPPSPTPTPPAPKPTPIPPPKPAPKPTPKPKPKPPPAPPLSAIDKWLAGDTTYQQQLAEYAQEKQAYNQNYTNDKNSISQNFDATQRAMNNQAALDRMNQQYDFAGRGVLASGAYAQALDQYNTQFQNNMGNLVTGENQQLTANQTNLNNFLRQLTIQQNAAKQDAIARRAAQLGITG